MRSAPLFIWASWNDTMWSGTYSLNAFAVVGRTMWITAAIFNTTTVACLAAAARPLGALRHWRMWDFVPDRGDPRSARLGGSLWFSKRKKSLMSASGRDLSERKSCVTKVMFCLGTPLSSLPFFLGSDWLAKVSMLFRVMVSDTGTEAFSSLSMTYAA